MIPVVEGLSRCTDPVDAPEGGGSRGEQGQRGVIRGIDRRINMDMGCIDRVG